MPPLLARGSARNATAGKKHHSRVSGGRISKFAGITCIAVAVLVDMLQALLVLVGSLSGATSVTLIGIPLAVAGVALTFLSAFMLSTLSYLAFGFYFLFGARVRFLTGTRALSRIGALFGSFIFELAPFFNGFPWLTAGVAHIVQSAWQEETADKQQAGLGNSSQPGRGDASASSAANDNISAPRQVARVAPPPSKKEIPKPQRFAA